jgi:opacity protein-like surface antigen
VTTKYSLIASQVPPQSSEFSGECSQLHYSGTIGVGAEYALSDNALLRVESLYDDHGDAEYKYDNGDVYEASLSAHTVTAAVSLKF